MPALNGWSDCLWNLSCMREEIFILTTEIIPSIQDSDTFEVFLNAEKYNSQLVVSAYHGHINK